MKTSALVHRVALVIACVGLSSPLWAQDVAIGDVNWAGADPAPDVLPVAKSRLRPDYPDELRKTNEIGYVIVERFVDAKGKSLSLSATGTHAPFQRAVEVEFQDWAMRPAQRGGQPVNAAVWLSVIFNPKSAAVKGAEATPRLLAVAPVITPVRPVRNSTSPVVRMRVSLDATGAITQAAPESEIAERALPAIQAALQSWRFAPARQNGQPVAADVVVSVLCQRPPQPAEAKVVPAKPIKQTLPDYPVAMRQYGLRGQVTIDFTVDTSGKVQNPVIFQSDNPAFDEPAITALREWKFEPGTRDGAPLALRQRQSIIFQLNETGDGGGSAFSFSRTGDQSKLPPELRYDTPPKIRGVLVPVYPYAQQREGMKGRAKAAMLINLQGRVAGVKVQTADQPEFGLALAAALEGFTFDPALKDGKPVMFLANFDQGFNNRELPDDGGDRMVSLEKKHPEKILSMNALDAPLKPLSRRAPLFPTGVAENVIAGEAMIECLIDEDGRVRLPRVVSATEPAFGYAAIQASAAWWFEPPKAGGKPAVVRVRLPFAFNLKLAKPAGAPPAGSAAKPSS